MTSPHLTDRDTNCNHYFDLHCSKANPVRLVEDNRYHSNCEAMDRLGGRKRLTEPLLPHGSNSLIETIVEEEYHEGYPDDIASYIIREEYSAIQPAISENLDFNTSVSSTSTGSYVDSTITNNNISGNHVRISSASSASCHSQRLLESSSSFQSSGSSHNYAYVHDNQEEPSNTTSKLNQNPFYNPGVITNSSCTNGRRNSCVGESSEISEFSTTSEDENDPLKDIEPTIDLDPHFDMNDYLPDKLISVEFLNIKNRIFEKHQSRKDKKARQMIVDGKVKISVSSDKPVSELKVWVRREPQAATLCNDKNGEVELKKPILLRHTNNQWLYVVDLDSVYQGRERPVYELAKVEMNERNIFEIVAQVIFQNGQSSKKIISKPFLTRTLKRAYQDEVPHGSAASSKRPHTWHSSGSNSKSPKYSPRPSYAENEVDSSASPMGSSAESSSSTTTTNLDRLIVDHLETQRAHIDHLTFGYIQTKRGDIAYHIRLTDQAQDQKLTEGVVVGFFPSDGKTKIEPLTSQNVQKAVMAGVISRSAYVEAEVPEKKVKGELTDAVCVIGMIGVQVQGSVVTGERIYTSCCDDGVAIPESHLPIGSFVTKENTSTMLGMAMEPYTPRRPGEWSLVKCFVCIVLGIGSRQLAREVEHVLESIETNLKTEVKKSSKRTWRRIYCFSALALFLLITTGFLLYQLLAPGTWYRYWRCSIGAKPDHYLKYKFKWDGKQVQVHGLEFDFDTLNVKLKDTVERSEIQPFRNTTTGVRFYLNVDRCAYGGETDGGFWGKTVKGGLVLVDACPCNITRPICKYVDGNKWCAYKTKRPLRDSLECNPKTCTHDQQQFSKTYPTFNSLLLNDTIFWCDRTSRADGLNRLFHDDES